MQPLPLRKPVLWCLLLCFWCPILQSHAQEALAIYPEDIYMEKTLGNEGFHLFIKKKPEVSSVLLTESTRDLSGQEDTYSYRALEWNPFNGSELRIIADSPIPRQTLSWVLIDSSPEYHPLLGEAFHIYIPPIITYGYPEGRHATLAVEDGIFINIRTFALPYANYAGPFKDNPFTLSITREYPDTSPASSIAESRPEIILLQPLELAQQEPFKPIIRLIPPDTPALIELDASPDLPTIPKADQEALSLSRNPEDTQLLEEILNRLNAPNPESPPPPEPKQEGLVFAPIINLWGGLAIFYPGPEGKSVGLKDNYNLIGAVTVTNQFTKAWGFCLGFDRDPMLMHQLFARATWDMDFIGIEVGPYFGLFNTKTAQVSSGLSLVFHLRIPKLNLFSSFERAATLGELTDPGDYTQSFSEIKAGYVLPFGRITLSITDRNSSLRDDLDVDRVNHWIRYNLALEIARSRSPWGFRLDTGYQKLHWIYRTSFLPLDYEYWDIYAGFEASYRIGYLTVALGLEAPLYPFTYPEIQSIESPQAPFFGQITLGLRWTFPRPD
ncbi:MAG: hypothetical protein LBK43_05335 [Treponema sp.]|jgi:hypothetical protein|nr:hypothetical protein [Treponema sp.]